MDLNTGDRVRCIDDSNVGENSQIKSGLVKGREYIIYGIEGCKCIGMDGVDVGLILPAGYEQKCPTCQKQISIEGKPMYVHHKRFVKVQEQYHVVEVAAYIKEEIKETIHN